jgi:TonB family protein
MLSLAIAMLLAQDPIVTGDRSLVSTCDVSDDPAYGYTMAQPIKVGGTPMFGPARQRRYLQALVGPKGQAIAFRRRGSMAPDANGIILDLYEVTYDGIERPIELYLDLYRWEPPKAPRGFACTRPLDLAPPDERELVSVTGQVAVRAPRPPDIGAPDPDQSYDRLLEAVLASGDIQRPIPLEPGSGARGMIFDLPRLMALAARELASRGETPSKANMPRLEPSFLIVAHAAVCNGRRVSPSEIMVEAGPAGRITAIDGPLKAGALRKAIPGVELREDSAGARFAGYLPPRAAVHVTFEGEACPALRFPITGTQIPRRVVDAFAVPPSGLTATPPGYIGNMTVKVSFSIGPNGVPYDISVVNGDARYAEAAIDAVRKWRFDLPTINGAPVYTPGSMVTDVVFR